MTDSLLTIDEVAEVLRLPERAVRRLVTAGDLEALKLPGHRLRFERAAVERFLEECRRGPGA